MSDEHDLTPEPQDTPDIPEEDLRFAPLTADDANDADEAPLVPDEPAESGFAILKAELAQLDDEPESEAEAEAVPDSVAEAEDTPPESHPVDIAAALAAVSSLGDYVAEQEAAEQARIAEVEAEERAAEEAQARLDYPERFFPFPPQVTLQRGQMASVVPALLLIAIGGWLTFTLTTTQSPPDTGLLLALGVGGAALTLAAYWLTASGGWARGILFFALSALLVGGVGVFLLQPASPGLLNGWPLLAAAWGLAFVLSGLLGRPTERGLVFPGLLLIVGGAVGYTVTAGLLNGGLVGAVGAFWPLILGIAAVLLLLPLVARRRG
ncbi:MAG: hypothetical protein H6671_15865 [Anaerolineaceae bacterium]|nr:hypothetical protein [Anaerolineaceae bacterium]